MNPTKYNRATNRTRPASHHGERGRPEPLPLMGTTRPGAYQLPTSLTRPATATASMKTSMALPLNTQQLSLTILQDTALRRAPPSAKSREFRPVIAWDPDPSTCPVASRPVPSHPITRIPHHPSHPSPSHPTHSNPSHGIPSFPFHPIPSHLNPPQPPQPPLPLHLHLTARPMPGSSTIGNPGCRQDGSRSLEARVSLVCARAATVAPSGSVLAPHPKWDTCSACRRAGGTRATCAVGRATS